MDNYSRLLLRYQHGNLPHQTEGRNWLAGSGWCLLLNFYFLLETTPTNAVIMQRNLATKLTGSG